MEHGHDLLEQASGRYRTGTGRGVQEVSVQNLCNFTLPGIIATLHDIYTVADRQ